MFSEVTAWSPGHISGYFRRIIGKDHESTGSEGAGIVISEGVTATVVPDVIPSVQILTLNDAGTYDKQSFSSPILLSVMEHLEISARIITRCNLPIGAGFGLSAAALLASITALNRTFELEMTPQEIAVLAHEIELIHQTGLGDVSACRDGGLDIRRQAGINAPVERLSGFLEPLFALSFGSIHTPSVLISQDYMQRVETAFPGGFPVDIKDFFRLSRIFAEKSGLITDEVRRVLQKADAAGIPASMIMLGNGVFAYGEQAKTLFMEFGRCYQLYIARYGPAIREERA